MKAGNKLQRYIVEIDKTLPKITQEQIDWAYDKTLMHLAIRIKSGKITCLDCAHSWKSETKQGWQDEVIGNTCSNCGTKLKIEKSQSKRFTDENHFQIFETHKGNQVIRTFNIKASYFAGYPCIKWVSDSAPKSYRYISEVSRVYITPDGKREVVGYTYQSTWCGYRWTNQFCLKSKASASKHNMNTKKSYPKRKFIKEINRTGFKFSLLNSFNHFDLFPVLISNSKSETLLKANQISLLKKTVNFRDNEKIELYWKTIKICIRNNYIVQDSTSYFDYLKDLLFFNRDLHSIKYVCPENFEKEHHRYSEKRRRLEDKEAFEALKLRIIEEEKDYAKAKKNFIGLEFGTKKINIKFLNKVKEVEQVGYKLKHCIYRSKYHKLKHSILFGAYVDNLLVESLEYDIETHKLRQARGEGNKPSISHDSIVKVFNDNIPKIKKAMKPVKKKAKIKTQKQVA
jgi:hypothetical protein